MLLPLSRPVLTLCGLLTFLTAWVATPASNNAAPAPLAVQKQLCHASSMLNELDARDRSKLEALLAAAAAIKNSQEMLWRIEKPGIAASYIFGTVHVIDEGLADLPNSVRAAIADSKVVALEAKEMSRAAMRYAMAQAGPLMVTRDRPLQFLLSPDEMSFVEDAIDRAGFPKQMALGWRPWVVNLFLSESPCQKAKAAAGLKSLDLLIAEEAKSKNKRIAGLENMTEQYETMASIDDGAQAAWLKASIHLHDRLDDMAHTMAELYRFRRLSMVWELTRELAPEAGLTSDVINSIQSHLVSHRNTRLADRAQPMLDDGSAFIAVGALHLAGPDGLVEMLRARGFTVKPVE